ncbi:MAG TPA: hypothetical protein VGG04_15775 [Candidatus Sulfotelmatobacter sp.]|jgi:carbonic anhydrase/acetyltransferase-like protein (isoleucine patch superfamily)
MSRTQAYSTITSGAGRELSSSLFPILGNDVLQTWAERIRKVGVQNIWLTAASRDGKETSPALGQLVRQGIERLLMIKLKSYAEMDLSDLVRFHCERRNSITEVLDSRGRLGISVFDQFALAKDLAKDKKSTGIPRTGQCTQYPFAGYAKRILSAKERQELVRDALTGVCAMRPAGEQIGDHVWLGEDVSVDTSAKIVGPSYIGDRTSVRAGATVGPFSSVERDCIVDCGSAVEHSTVLPSTYLGVGLMFRHAMVDGSQLQDLDSGVIADLEPAGLARRIAPRQSKRQTSTRNEIFSPDCNAWLGAQYATVQQVQP